MWHNEYNINKTYIGRLSFDGDLLEEVNLFCQKNNIETGWISVIGALKAVKLGFYDQDKKEYVYINDTFSNNPFEISSCSGNISIKDGTPFAHMHIVASGREGNCLGGHVMPGTKVFAGEFMIQSFDGKKLERSIDEETKLSLWNQN